MIGPGGVALLAAAAVLLGTPSSAAARRRLRPRGRGARGTPRPGEGAPVPRGARADPTARLSAAVAAVAAEVRAGRAPAEAWRLVLGVPAGPDGVPDADDVVAAVAGVPRGPVTRFTAALDRPGRAARRTRPRGRGAGRPGGGHGGHGGALLRSRVAGVLAATRLATDLGAPLAGVLDGCARSLTADADAETAVRAALAGPRQTTTLLTWLPALGVVLGTMLGADAIGVLLGGGLGSTAGLVGTLLTLTGRAWVGRMADRARGAGTDGSGG